MHVTVLGSSVCTVIIALSVAVLTPCPHINSNVTQSILTWCFVLSVFCVPVQVCEFLLLLSSSFCNTFFCDLQALCSVTFYYCLFCCKKNACVLTIFV